jgi:hypothetical protein
VSVDLGDDVAIHLSDENRPGDLEGLGVGDPVSFYELGFLAESLEHLRDLRSAAVNDDASDPDRVHQDDVTGDLTSQLRIGESASSGLGHDRLPAKALNMGKRLTQNGCGPGAVGHG